jgi:hypothetical protein
VWQGRPGVSPLTITFEHSDEGAPFETGRRDFVEGAPSMEERRDANLLTHRQLNCLFDYPSQAVAIRSVSVSA